ncbi:MAG: flagellar biosynthetic protein FliR [bacterium]|nr:flagellar biosynthetic protein FliR [bacterium]
MFLPGTLEAFGLYLVRTSALVLASPLLGSGAGFSGYKVGLIFAMSLLLYSVGGVPLAAEPSVVVFGVFALREVVVGLLLAFVLHAVVLAVRVGAELIGHEMAFNMSNIIDPASGVSTPLIAHMYETLLFLALLAVDGHHWILRALAESFTRAPVASIDFELAAIDVALTQFTQLFAAGIAFAAPILVLLSLISVVIGLLARAVPQINVLEFGFNLRIIVGLLAMALFSPLLTPAFDGLLERLMEGLDASLAALEV